ncbi:leucyl aminopeptidase, partial [Micromonospora zhanjiangensis]
MTSPSTTLSLVDTDPAELSVDAIVIGVHSQTGGGDGAGPARLADTLLLATGAEAVAVAFDGRLTETLAL